MLRPTDATAILRSATDGRAGAAEQLLPHLYDELRRLAQSHLRRERPDHTLQATALVHEAYLRLVDQSNLTWRDRAHFFAIAAQAIRRILVDHARSKGRRKRGGDRQRVEFDESLDIGAEVDLDPGALDLLALEEALERLRDEYPERERVVELRFFGGLKTDEVAEVLGVSSRTVENYWRFARAWLYRELVGQ